MKVYLTGLGFLGKHLAEKLDNFISIPHEDIQTYKYKPYSRFFFLSAYGNLSTQTESDKIVKANVLDLAHVLSKTNWEDGVESFVYVSTSSVTRKIQTMYSRTKKAAEELLLAYMEKYNAPICIVRPLSITGIGEQPSHLIPTLIRSCIKGESMPFVPEPVHDYIDVEDVVDGILTLSKRHAKGVFELGSGVSLSNLEIKELVEKITGKKANTHEVKNLRPYDSEDWVSRNFSARSFGWSPKKSMFQTITEMVEYEQT